MNKANMKKLANLILITVIVTGIVVAVSGYRPNRNEVTVSMEDSSRRGDSTIIKSLQFEEQENGAKKNQTEFSKGMRGVGMGLAVGLSSVGAGLAVAKTGSAAIGSVTEKPELFGRTIIYVGLAEGIAIYGLLVSFLLWIGFP